MTENLSLLVAAGAASFDAEIATRAYLATLEGAARARSDAYFEGGYWLGLWGALIATLGYWLMLRTGWSAKWSAFAKKATTRRWLRPAIYSLPYTLVATLIMAPWLLYTEYVREHQYGMSNQSLGDWFAELAIGSGVELIIGAVFFTIFWAVIRNSPKRWWLWGTGTFTVLVALTILVQPIFIDPLLNKYTPLKPGPERTEILRIAHEQAIPADNVFVFDASKQTKRISANVGGIGPTVRIALNDNLLNRSNLSGIKAVMGHEMGHYKMDHMLKLIGYLGLLALAGFGFCAWAAPRLLERYGDHWGVKSLADPASAPLLFAILALLQVPGQVAFNSVIRHHESQADAFGLDAAREPDGFAMTAMQLGEYRKLEPSPIEEILFYDHPSGRTRVKMAMEWKARHLAELPADQQKMMVMTSPEAAE